MSDQVTAQYTLVVMEMVCKFDSCGIAESLLSLLWGSGGRRRTALSGQFMQFDAYTHFRRYLYPHWTLTFDREKMTETDVDRARF